MLLAIEVDEILHKVHNDDVAKAEARYTAAKNARQALRAQDAAQQLNTSELLKKLAASIEDEPKSTEIIKTPGVSQQETSNERPRPQGFPAPPTGPGSR